MSFEDFDIEGLARYLHLAVSQIQRMVERGQVPARRIGGQWRFSQAEIHHWLEERIGLSDESQLADVEGALDRHHGDQESVALVDLLPIEAIQPQLAAKTRGAVIDAMAALAASTGLLWDAAKMAEAVRARENLHPTALDNGVALLHPRRPMSSIIAEPFLALGRTPSALPFGGPRGSLTDLFFLICSVSDAGHLRALARLSRLLATASVVDALRASPDALAMRDVIQVWEEQLKK